MAVMIPARPGSVLVTGGAGYIGTNVMLALLAAGWPVLVLDDFSTGRRRAVHRLCTVVTGNVADTALVRRLLAVHDVVGVIHLAASIVVPESVRRPLAYYANNTIASHALLEACVEHGVPAFIFSSTAAVYGMPERSPVDETMPPRPLNPYGSSKLMVEQMLADVDRACDLPHVILRYFNVAGADPQLRAGQNARNSTHLIKVACETALGLRPAMTIFGEDYPTPDGTCVRDFVHVSDLAAAHVAALDHLLRGGASITLNCGYGRGYSVREVIAAVERAAGVHVPVKSGPRRAGDSPSIVAAADRIRVTLAWQPRYADLDTIVRHALAWERLQLTTNAVPQPA